MAAKIRKGDQVKVIAGKDKNKTGEVQSCYGDRVIVKGINMVKKSTKGDPNRGIQGGIIEKEMSIHVSNIAHFDAKTGKPSRIGFKTLEDGKKVRYLKSTQEVI